MKFSHSIRCHCLLQSNCRENIRVIYKLFILSNRIIYSFSEKVLNVKEYCNYFDIPSIFLCESSLFYRIFFKKQALVFDFIP